MKFTFTARYQKPFLIPEAHIKHVSKPYYVLILLYGCVHLFVCQSACGSVRVYACVGMHICYSVCIHTPAPISESGNMYTGPYVALQRLDNIFDINTLSHPRERKTSANVCAAAGGRAVVFSLLQCGDVTQPGRSLKTVSICYLPFPPPPAAIMTQGRKLPAPPRPAPRRIAPNELRAAPLPVAVAERRLFHRNHKISMETPRSTAIGSGEAPSTFVLGTAFVDFTSAEIAWRADIWNSRRRHFQET